MRPAALLALMPALLFAGDPQQAPPAAPAPKPAAAPAAQPEDKVLARIGTTVIRASDFELFLGMAVPNPQQRMQVEMVQGAKDQYLKQFLELRTLAAKAKAIGLDKGEAFRRKREMMEMQLLIQDLMGRESAQLQAKMKLPETAAKDYYDKNPEAFRTKGSFSARHILISVKKGPEGQGLTEEEAKAKVAKLEEELKAGKKLEELTKDNSDDPGSKEKGGLYENIAFGSFVPEFEEAVKKQEIGKVGAPVRTSYGYHLIQVESRAEAELQPFEKVKDQAQEKAQQARQEEVFQAYLAQVRKEVGYVEGAAAAKAPAPAKKAKAAPASGAK